jgi:hypothetical protein
MKEEKKEIYKQKERARTLNNHKPIQKTKKNNSFSALCYSSSEEEDNVVGRKTLHKGENKKKSIVDLFPPLSKVTNTTNKPVLSYKNVIAQTYKDIEENLRCKEEEEIFKRLNEKKFIKSRPVVMEAPTIQVNIPKKYKNWADYTSSDDEEDEEEEKKVCFEEDEDDYF